MKLVSVILDDSELDRILMHAGWSVEFPRTKSARAPPDCASDMDEAGQVDTYAEQWDGRQDWPSGDWPA